MAQIRLTFGFDINRNLKVGDTVYFITEDGGTEELGTAFSIVERTLTVDVTAMTVRPDVGAFIVFSPGRTFEEGEVTGYENTVVFVNDSTKKAELFAVSGEYFPSSR